MAFYFLDTSAVVKLYVQETGSAWLRNLADPSAGHFFFMARITDVEMTAAIARRRRDGSLSIAQTTSALNQFRQDFAHDYRVVEITIPLLRHASQLADTHVLRAYDAIQLAAVLDIYQHVPSLTLISADGDLNTATMAEGLAVDDPNTHP